MEVGVTFKDSQSIISFCPPLMTSRGLAGVLGIIAASPASAGLPARAPPLHFQHFQATTSIIPSPTVYDQFYVGANRGSKAKLSVIALKVVICDLIGLSYVEYNVNREEFAIQQQVINNAILTINNNIDKLNNADNLIGVKWSFHIHKLRHGRRGHRYTNTMSDGLHFTDETKDKFAKYLTRRGNMLTCILIIFIIYTILPWSYWLLLRRGNMLTVNSKVPIDYDKRSTLVLY